MEDKLQIKISHYSEYIAGSISNFKNRKYSDAVINSRKGAEAACKILIYHALPTKRADDKIADKSLKELIQVLIKDRLAERKVINTLESLQIIGNRAAHDNVISKEEASYSLNALQLLTDYLFTEQLKIKIPGTINFDFEPEKKAEIKAPEVIEKIVVQEKIIKQGLDKESEEALLDKLKDYNQAERKKFEELLKLQQQSLHEELNEFKRSASSTSFEVLPPVEKKSAIRNVVLVLAVLLVILLGLWLLVRTTETHVPEAYSTNANPLDTVYVAINKIAVLQDNPQLEFKIEEVLSQYIQRKAKFVHVPIKMSFISFGETNTVEDSVLVKKALGLRYHVLYWGNIYESTLDSNVLEIKGCLTNNIYFFRNHKLKFKNLSDSVFIKELNDQANTPVYSHGMFLEKKGDYTHLINNLTSLKSFSEENYLSMKDRLAYVYTAAGEMQKASALYDTLIQIRPTKPIFYYYKGKLFYKWAKLDSAERYYLLAYQKDSVFVPNLEELGLIYAVKGNTTLALYYIHKTLLQSPKHPKALQAQKLIRNLKPGHFLLSSEYRKADDSARHAIIKGDFKKAITWYERASAYSPINPDPITQIAKCYFSIGDSTHTIEHITKSYAMDSLHENTVVYLAGLSDWMKHHSPNSNYYYQRALRLFPTDTFLLLLASRHYYKIGDYKRCVDVGKLAEKCNYKNKRLSTNTATAAYNIKEYYTAKTHYEYLNLMFSNDTIKARLAQTYHAYCNGNPKAPEYQAGLKLIEEAYKLNPRSLINMSVYSSYMTSRDNYYQLEKMQRGMGNTFSATNYKEQDPMKRMIELNEKSSKMEGPVLYQDKELKIIMLTANETVGIKKQYKDSTALRIVHHFTGLRESGSDSHKNKQPIKNAAFPNGKQIVDLVMSNKKLNPILKMQFLSVELGYYQKRQAKDGASASEMVTYIRTILKNGK